MPPRPPSPPPRMPPRASKCTMSGSLDRSASSTVPPRRLSTAHYSPAPWPVAAVRSWEDRLTACTSRVALLGQVYDIVVQQGDLGPPEPTEQSIQRGDELFAVGSILYSIAAFVSALKAATAEDTSAQATTRRRTAIATASLYELGGVCFVVGTLGFVPASTIGIAACPDGTRTMESFGASLFVVGSAFYTLGSSLVLWVVGRETMSEEYPTSQVSPSSLNESCAHAKQDPCTSNLMPP